MFNGFNISDISECYFGSNEIAEIYLGSNKLWPNGTTPPTPVDNWVSLADVSFPINIDGIMIYDNSLGRDGTANCEIGMYLCDVNGNVIDSQYRMSIKFEYGSNMQSKLFIWSETGAWSNNFYIGNNSQTGNHVIRYSDVESDLVSWDSNNWGIVNFSYLMQLINNEMNYNQTAAYFQIRYVQNNVAKSHFKIKELT